MEKVGFPTVDVDSLHARMARITGDGGTSDVPKPRQAVRVLQNPNSDLN